MTPASLDGFTVLVLEDDYYLADDTRQALENAGAKVLGPCPNAAAGFQALEGHHADCAVVDVNLGQGPSFDPARTLLAKGVPVVLVTGYDTKVIPDELASVPCRQKPTEARKVLKAVKELCSAAHRSS